MCPAAEMRSPSASYVKGGGAAFHGGTTKGFVYIYIYVQCRLEYLDLGYDSVVSVSILCVWFCPAAITSVGC